MYSNAIMEPLQKTVAYKGVKITTHKKMFFLHYKHWLRDAFFSRMWGFSLPILHFPLCYILRENIKKNASFFWTLSTNELDPPFHFGHD